MQKICSKEN